MNNIRTVYNTIGPQELSWTIDICKTMAPNATIEVRGNFVIVSDRVNILKLRTNGK